MIRFQARTFFSSPGHMLKIHFAKKRMGKNIKHGCNSDRRNPPPCIWGHHYQLDDNLVGQLTTSRDIFASQNDGPSRPNSRTSRAPSMGSLVKILPLIKYFFLQIMNFWYRKRLFLKHRNKQDLYLIERWIAVSAVGLARGALTGHLFNRKHRRYNLQLQYFFKPAINVETKSFFQLLRGPIRWHLWKLQRKGREKKGDCPFCCTSVERLDLLCSNV